MAITVSGNSIVFPDSTTQTTAFSGGGGGGIQGLAIYNSPGTFTTPANTTSVYLIGISGGGGGGGSQQIAQPEGPYNAGGSPGGPGILGVGVYPVSASTPYSISAGTGGATGVTSPQNAPGNATAGSAGGASAFGNLLTINGGNGGGTPSNSPGNPGNAPLAQATATVGPTSAVVALTIQNAGSGTGSGAAGGVGGAGQPGKLLVYY
jgi:hypothetical protein